MDKIQKIVKSEISVLYMHYYSLLNLLNRAAPAWQKLGSNNFRELEDFYTHSRERLERQKGFLNKLKKTLESKLRYNYSKPANNSLIPKQHVQLKEAIEKRAVKLVEKEGFQADAFKEQLENHLQGWYKRYLPLIACLQVYSRIDSYYLVELCSADLSLLQALLELQLQQIENLRTAALESFLQNERVIELKVREEKRAEALKREKRQLKNNSQRLKMRLAGHYRLLRVAPCSPLNEVKSSWKRQVKRYHPDYYGYDKGKQEEAKRFTQRLNRAYHEIREYYKRIKIVLVP